MNTRFSAHALQQIRTASLQSQDLDGLATLLNSRKSVKVGFLTGAGISVAAGIPDFRSPGGMYDTLQPELLTAQVRDRERMMDDPTAVVSKDLFFRNPFPYLELRRPFILGTGDRKWKMTIAHAFQRLCYDRGLLHRVYTQNIDGLDFQTNIPQDMLVNVHGTMGSVSCEHCKVSYPIEQFRDDVRRNIKDIYHTDPQAPLESSLILCPQCAKPGLKPDTVLYGGSLPSRFFECLESDREEVDILVIAGTSLTVSPANSVPYHVKESCVRVVMNAEPVGQDLGIDCRNVPYSRDLYVEGPCDESFLKLIVKLGWFPDLLALKHDLAELSLRLVDNTHQNIMYNSV